VTDGSWLNLVEVFFWTITRQAIRRGTFTSVGLRQTLRPESARKFPRSPDLPGPSVCRHHPLLFRSTHPLLARRDDRDVTSLVPVGRRDEGKALVQPLVVVPALKCPANPLEREKGLHVGSEHRDEGLRENQDGQAVVTLWAVSPLL
jgi:hypothetical protein